MNSVPAVSRRAYTPLAILLHWSLAILILGPIVLGWHHISLAPNPPPAPVDAPFVSRASDQPPASAPDLGSGNLPMSRATTPAPLLTMADPSPEPPRKGVIGKVKGFFASIFK